MIDTSSFADHPAMLALTADLRAQYGDSVAAILFYGSCLRSGDLCDGIVDLYVIVDNYRTVYPRRWLAIANKLLPPNVFYRQLGTPDGIVRSKYALLSMRDFERGVSLWFQSYLWGRFTQPVTVVYCRDEASRNNVAINLMLATVTFLRCALPRVPAQGTVQDLWSAGLALSYRTELRAENKQRGALLVEQALSHYVAATEIATSFLPFQVMVEGKGSAARYTSKIPSWRRAYCRLMWGFRRVQGKVYAILRLIKALFTFSQGLDYIAWKLERHSGRPVVIPERVRRHPLLFGWVFYWKLYRKGFFR